MATTLDPASLSPCAGKYPLPMGHFDEAFATASTARARLVPRRQDELRDDQVGGQLRLLVLPDPLDLDLDHDGALAGVKGRGDGDDLVAEQAGGEDVELQLDRGEVVLRRDVAEGRPGGDGVAEGGPDAAVDETAGMEVAPVDDDAAAGEGVLDLDRFDPQVAGKAAADEGAHVLRGESRTVRCCRALVHRVSASS